MREVKGGDGVEIEVALGLIPGEGRGAFKRGNISRFDANSLILLRFKRISFWGSGSRGWKRADMGTRVRDLWSSKRGMMRYWLE